MLGKLLLNFKSYFKPLPLDTGRYLFKKRVNGNLFYLTIKESRTPIFLRMNSSDVRVFDQVFHEKQYNLELAEAPEVILDCGANIGLTSVYFANRYPHATIIAIEPEEDNFKMLKKNTEAYKNVHCINYGVWNKTANLQITPGAKGAWSFTVKEVNYEDGNTIKAISIEDIMKMFSLKKIDLLKIDIEGSEKEVFAEGSEYWLPQVKTIILELHDSVKKGCTQSLINALKNYDYALEPLCECVVVRL